jgi:hypothetical protein
VPSRGSSGHSSRRSSHNPPSKERLPDAPKSSGGRSTGDGMEGQARGEAGGQAHGETWGLETRAGQETTGRHAPQVARAEHAWQEDRLEHK